MLLMDGSQAVLDRNAGQSGQIAEVQFGHQVGPALLYGFHTDHQSNACQAATTFSYVALFALPPEGLVDRGRWVSQPE
jgi:hypothetical protein